MRNKVGTTLSVIGGFLILVALLGMFYAPGPLMKTPLDVDSHTSLSGSGELGGETVPVKAFSVTYTDSEKSDDDVVVWCELQLPGQGRGRDRRLRVGRRPRGAAAVGQHRLLRLRPEHRCRGQRPRGVPPGGGREHEGLVNKLPFDSEKNTYPYWDSTGATPSPPSTRAPRTSRASRPTASRSSVADAPARDHRRRRGHLQHDDRRRSGSSPSTGAIIDQEFHSQVRVRRGRRGRRSTLELSFTDDEVTDYVADAEAQPSKLNLATKTVPLVGFVAGIPLAAQRPRARSHGPTQGHRGLASPPPTRPVTAHAPPAGGRRRSRCPA